MSNVTFPTEIIDLPSGGKFYPDGHPLKGGQVELKYMTAKEEDILTSTNLIQKGVVLDKLSIPFPNHWDLFGGHVEVGETPEEALRRELQEEIGATLDSRRLTAIAAA